MLELADAGELLGEEDDDGNNAAARHTTACDSRLVADHYAMKPATLLVKFRVASERETAKENVDEVCDGHVNSPS